MPALRGAVLATLTTAVLVTPVLATAPSVDAAPGGGRPTCGSRTATIVGTSGADTLVGTRRNDVIVGLGGDDVISGRGRNDFVCGGAGADRLLGGPGRDRLFGERDRLDDGPAGTALVGDVLDGGPGDDRLDGGRDGRRADSRTRLDTYSWASSPERVVVDVSDVTDALGRATGAGRDRLVVPGAGIGLVGSPRGDRITGSPGPDRVDGGAGNDTISSRGGADRVYPDGLRGLAGSDRITTGGGADLVSSLTGGDRVDTGTGADFVEAFSSRPTRVRTGPGNDYLGQHLTRGRRAAGHGGRGDDVLVLDGGSLRGDASSVTVDLRSGTTRAEGVRASGAVSGFEGVRLLGPLRWGFVGTARADRVWAVQGGPLRAATGGGDDRITGTDRADRLIGGPGTDTGFGRGGRDSCRSIERGDC